MGIAAALDKDVVKHTSLEKSEATAGVCPRRREKNVQQHHQGSIRRRQCGVEILFQRPNGSPDPRSAGRYRGGFGSRRRYGRDRERAGGNAPHLRHHHRAARRREYALCSCKRHFSRSGGNHDTDRSKPIRPVCSPPRPCRASTPKPTLGLRGKSVGGSPSAQ